MSDMTLEKFQTVGGRWYGYGACEFCTRTSVLTLNALDTGNNLCPACEDHFQIEGGYPNPSFGATEEKQ